jgi:hypothetical protein
MGKFWIVLSAFVLLGVDFANASNSGRMPFRKVASSNSAEDFYGYYLVQCDYEIHVREADQSPLNFVPANKNEFTDVQVYISKKSDTKYSPDAIGKDLIDVYFRANPASASMIVDLCKRKLAKSPEDRTVDVEGTKDAKQGYYNGTMFSSWPE